MSIFEAVNDMIKGDANGGKEPSIPIIKEPVAVKEIIVKEQAKKPSSAQPKGKKGHSQSISDKPKPADTSKKTTSKKPVVLPTAKPREEVKKKPAGVAPQKEEVKKRPTSIEKSRAVNPKVKPSSSAASKKPTPSYGKVEEKPQTKPIEKPSSAKEKKAPVAKTPSSAEETPKPKVPMEEVAPSVIVLDKKEPEKSSDLEKPIVQREVEPFNGERSASFGLGYFFGEGSVPPEVENLVQCFADYADELVAAEKENPKKEQKEKPADPLIKIEEEVVERDTPTVAPEALPETNKKPENKTEQPAKPKPSLNPLSSSNLAKATNETKKKPQKFASSYDSATLTGAIGLLDLKSLCRSFAYAIRQHIVFSQGKQTFADLRKDGEARFSYKLGKMLRIELPEKVDPVANEINMDKSKTILSESLAAMTGTHVKPELLNSYLTVEDNEEDFDLSYTQSHIGDIFGKNKPVSSEALIKSYRNSLASLRSSEIAKNSLLKTQNYNRMTIQGHSDVNRLLSTQQNNRNSIGVHRRQSSDELDREEAEAVDLDSVDITKSYTSPKKLQNALSPVKEIQSPSDAVPDNVFEMSKDKENNESAEYLEEFQVYNLNYDFDSKSFIDLATIPGQYLEIPTEREIYKFCKKILVYSKMEKEIPIIALIYVEKLVLKTGLLMNELNWRRFTFIALVIASKVWDDESFENVHFTKAFPDVSLVEINELERIYLKFLDYKLHINGSEYAKYYFILRTVSEKANVKFPLKPMPVNKVLELQKNAEKVQENMKGVHNTLSKTQ